MSSPAFDQSNTAWISRGFEQLVARYQKGKETFDVLIVGSGYGGAIAADTLSQYVNNKKPLKICVLERGKEYLPGSFPANSTELPGHVRIPGKKDGLFDFRASSDVVALIANGLGGGSLINAGVMIEPLPGVFKKGWPSKLNDHQKLDKYYRRAELLLGSKIGDVNSPTNNTITTEYSKNNRKKTKKLDKYETLLNLGKGGKRYPANITVAAKQNVINSGNVQLDECIRCGDCATGCNHNAKDSLDTNLLYRAHCRGVEIFSGATVLNIQRDQKNKIWLVNTVFTDTKLRLQHRRPIRLQAEKVILAAGTLGSTEILKRSESGNLKFSRMLGQRCSTNGDTMITHFDTKGSVNAVGDEKKEPKIRNVGPTITGVVDLREFDCSCTDKSNCEHKDLPGLLIEEIASPASMRRIFSEIYATVNTMHHLAKFDGTSHKPPKFKRNKEPTDETEKQEDIYELNDSKIDGSALYAVMGDDHAEGEIELVDSSGARPIGDAGIGEDGIARIRWKGVAQNRLFDKEERALKALAGNGLGTVLANPLWKLLPQEIALIIDVDRGPVLTVHPLGGCTMANSSTDGVVDHLGRVFEGGDTQNTHPGLVVLDGSIIPTSLSANPALTIAAVSLRAANKLAKNKWDYVRSPSAWDYAQDKYPHRRIYKEIESEFAKNGNPLKAATRPRFRQIKDGFNPAPTKIRITERMSGTLPLQLANGHTRDYVIELTLYFEDKELRQLTHQSARKDNGKLFIKSGKEGKRFTSSIRIFDNVEFKELHKNVMPAREMEDRLDDIAKFSSPVTCGSLQVLERQKSWSIIRLLRALGAWALNYGIRDVLQACLDKESGARPGGILKSAFAIASRAGEIRALKYEITLRDPISSGIPICSDIKTITGEKRLTFSLRSNPWKQLMRMRLTRFPAMADRSKARFLELDLEFLARIRTPLLEITDQNDGVTALGELGSFLNYVARMIVGIHAWSFRAPDAETIAHLPQRLPGKLDKIDRPEIHNLFIGNERPYGSEKDKGDRSAEVPVYVRLTRYRNAEGKEKKSKKVSYKPLVMMHGYSASGTTFAHNAVEGNLASYFCKQGRDVWVVDFRTSCGMPTASLPWSFEQVAYRDIPEAIKFICAITNKHKVDVIAHCMGAAMFSMAILHPEEHAGQFPGTRARAKLRKRIRRVVFTQVGPLVVFSPVNIFRAYIMKFFRELLPDNYQFNPGPNSTVADGLLDRLLTTMPYPDEEFRIENPRISPWARTPWTRTRHRMDALYGRVFNAKNMDKKVLAHIDDFFGPFSIDTVAQTINFSRYNMVTDVEGRNRYVSRRSLVKQWGKIRLLNVNATENGLADVRTAYRMNEFFLDAGRSHQFVAVSDAGHQDCLIGNVPRRKTLKHIKSFLDAKKGKLQCIKNIDFDLIAYPPWIGPLVTREAKGHTSIRLGIRPNRRQPVGFLLMRVLVNDREIKKSDGKNFSQSDPDTIVQEAFFYRETNIRIHRWGKVRLPKKSRKGKGHPGNAWLVMVVYNDSDSLEKVDPGLYRFVTAQQHQITEACLMPVDSRLRRRSATIPLGIHGFVASIDASAGQRTAIGSGETASTRGNVYSGLCPPGLWIPNAMDTDDAESAAVLRDQDSLDRLPTVENFNLVQTDGQEVRGDVIYNGQLETPEPPPRDVAQAILNRFDDEEGSLWDGIIQDVDVDRVDECSFVLGSCQYPAGLLDEQVAYRSYRKLARRLSPDPTEAAQTKNEIVPLFAILVGDQIYADASAGLFDPSIRNGRFRLPYQRWLRNECVRKVLRQIPSYMLPDDHEITDNWEPIIGNRQVGKQNRALRKAGMKGYKRFQRGFNSTLPMFFKAEGFHFFMLDTRSMRKSRTVRRAQTARLFPPRADVKLVKWLHDQRNVNQDRPRFIVTPSVLLPRHRVASQWEFPESSLKSDGWDGYPRSLYMLLQLIAHEQYKNIIFLSGDEHFPCYARIILHKKGSNSDVIVHSIHTAALYAPFPFANGMREGLIGMETIDFDVINESFVGESYPEHHGVNPSLSRGYRCKVEAAYPTPGDGMTYLRIRKNGGRWRLTCEFANGFFEIPDLETQCDVATSFHNLPNKPKWLIEANE